MVTNFRLHVGVHEVRVASFPSADTLIEPIRLAAVECVSEATLPKEQQIRLDKVAQLSQVLNDEYETHFSNRWMEPYGHHVESMDLCMTMFHHEYNDVGPLLWKSSIEMNDAELEATKNNPSTPA